MDFLFGSQNIDKTTCLIHLANQFIINNNIKPNNGYILMFTPPHTPIPAENANLLNISLFILHNIKIILI